MILFFDTSALVKFFHEEEGTETVTQLINSSDNKIYVLDLCKLEFFSALYRRFRNNEIDEYALSSAIDGFEEEIERFNIERLSYPVLQESESLLKKYGRIAGLRTLDALHLGCFSLISENNWHFVSSDDNLCNIAKIIGFKVINPLNA